MLAPLDIFVLLKIVAKRGQRWSQRDLSYELSVSQSSVHAALKNATEAKLYNPSRKLVSATRLEEALAHGAKYFLVAKRGGEVRGMPTAWAAPPLSNEIAANGELPPVWPDPLGESRGLSLEPLHPSVPKAAMLDPLLYELLALLDALRVGGARESKLAEKELHQRLHLR